MERPPCGIFHWWRGTRQVGLARVPSGGLVPGHEDQIGSRKRGAAYLVAKAIKAAKVVGFADLGMEAIYEFDVQDMPVTVAVDSNGTAVHSTGPKEWQIKIGKIPYTEPVAH